MNPVNSVITIGRKKFHCDANFIEALKRDSNDTQSLIFFQRELEFVESEIFRIEYPEKLMASGMLIPITSKAGPGANTYSYKMLDRIGAAKIINSYAKDFKRIALTGKKVDQTIKSIGDSYGFNFQEIRSAREAGVSIETENAIAAREALDDLKEEIGFSGDQEADLKGFNELVESYGTEVIIPADGTGSSKAFSNKDGDKIVRDLSSLVEAIIDVTNGREKPDTILLPLVQHTLITTKRMPDINMTVAKYFLENNPWINSLVPYYKMKGAGDSLSDRMIAYKKDPSKVHYEMPVIMENLPNKQTPTETEFYLHGRVAGIIMKRPLSTAFADEI